jgi:hypothetical protein
MPISDIKFTNNARTLLSTSSLANDATSVSVDDGSVFPSLSSGNYFYATLERASDSTTREIVKVTARSGNDLTIVRAQDNTSATTFSADDIIELRLTAKAIEDIRDAVSPTLTQEQVEDYVGGMLDGTETFIDVSYDDTDGNIDFVVPVKDEDNMASDSATHLATQQSIKAYVDTQVGTNTLTVYKYTATAGQTTFTGSDDASATLAYTVGHLFVTVNGITLENGTDYTATNGTSVVLTDAATVDDEVNIYVFAAFNVSNVTQANGDFSVGDDLTLGSDGAIINMGADSDVTMTHVHNVGVRVNTGVLFGSDTAAANALDDYEEGSFTVTCTYDTTINNSPDYDSSATLGTGYYTKIGNLVNVFFPGMATSFASNADIMVGTYSLPFTANANNISGKLITGYALHGYYSSNLDTVQSFTIGGGASTGSWAAYTVSGSGSGYVRREANATILGFDISYFV